MRQILTATCVFAALAIAGCGSKDDDDAPIGAVDTARPAGLGGSTFEATDEGGGGRLVIQFTDGQTVTISVLAPGTPDGTGAAVGTYTTSGDQVIVSVQGDPETFTLKGNTLVGTFGGEQVTFKRK